MYHLNQFLIVYRSKIRCVNLHKSPAYIQRFVSTFEQTGLELLIVQVVSVAGVTLAGLGALFEALEEDFSIRDALNLKWLEAILLFQLKEFLGGKFSGEVAFDNMGTPGSE